MGNTISRTYPAGILKTAAPKKVSWGNEQIKIISKDSWESVPVLNTHEIARRTAQIKKTPIVTQPVQTAAQIPMRTAKPKPKWNWWQKLARGRKEVVGICVLATAFCAGFAGPFALLIPAIFLVYCGAVYLYRKYGPQAEVVAKSQEINARLRKKYEHKAQAMRLIGNIEQAKAYEQLVKRLR